MGQVRKKANYQYNDTSTTLLVALFGGACGFVTIESTIGDVMDAWGLQMNRLPAWQAHMGSVCVGIITFFVFLFILEFLETKSRITAWRSSSPWLPLVGSTALATFVHIPFYIVFPICASYAVWAYHRTCSVRSSPAHREQRERHDAVAKIP